MKTIYFVVPCYNEEAALPETAKQLCAQMEGLVRGGLAADTSRILFVDDGSRDNTWAMIASLCEEEKIVCGLRLSRNCGHQNALLAGLLTAKELCDAAISLDADLQDDVAAIPEFVKKFNEGCDIVYGVRNARENDTVFKRGTAHGFYSLMRGMGVGLVPDHADYRLMSRRAIEALSEFREVNLFLRGVVPLLGFKTASVFYARKSRIAGESKYPLKKMIAFAIDGITSFSVVPLRIISAVGFVISAVSIVALVYAFISKLTGNAQAGWATTIGSIWLIGGVELLCLGICGEYIGKIYKEVKARPHYIIDSAIIK